MHFSTLLPALLVLFSSALANPAPANEAIAQPIEDIAVREAEPEVAKRAACKCAKVKDAGLYCGYCNEVTSYSGDKWDWVFWCNKQGGCDEIGYRKSCNAGNGPCDGRNS